MMLVSSVARLVFRIATLLIWMLTVISGYAGHVPPALWALPAVLVLAFPYLFVFSIVLGVIWLLMRRFVMAGICGLVVFICLPSATVSCPLRVSRTPSSSKNVFTLLSYNVMKGIENTKQDFDYSRAYSYMIASGADVICAQELSDLKGDFRSKASDAQLDSLRKIYPFIIEGKTVSQTIFSKFPVVIGEKFPRKRGDFAVFHLKIKDRRVDIASVHLASFMLSEKERGLVKDLKTSDPKDGIRELRNTVSGKLLEGFRQRASDAVLLRDVADRLSGNLIICGDFNDVPASWVYNEVRGDDMNDAVAETGFGPLHTYNDHQFYFRIDQVLYRGDLRAISVERSKIDASDHYPLLVTFEFTGKKIN